MAKYKNRREEIEAIVDDWMDKYGYVPTNQTISTSAPPTGAARA